MWFGEPHAFPERVPPTYQTEQRRDNWVKKNYQASTVRTNDWRRHNTCHNISSKVLQLVGKLQSSLRSKSAIKKLHFEEMLGYFPKRAIN